MPRFPFVWLLVCSCILSVAPTGEVNAAVPNNPATGAQNTLVLLVNFRDSGLTPWPVSEAQAAVFGDADSYFRAVSNGRMWLTGDVRGWFTLPIDSTCDTAAISQYADAAARNAGIDLTHYGRFLYVYAGTAQCRAAGASSMTRYPSQTFLNGSLARDLITHELGHAIGLPHALLVDCGSQSLGGNCTYDQDDAFDVMGSATALAPYNAVNKERLGWLGTGDVAVAASDGTYTLEPLSATGSTYPKVLKVYRNTDPNTGVRYWFYVEYRQAVGYDAFLAGNANVLGGVLVRIGVDPADLWVHPDAIDSSVLVDMTPDSQYGSYSDHRDPALVAGSSFTDPLTGVRLDTVWADGYTAGVRVSLGSGGTLPPSTSTNHPPLAIDDAVSTSADVSVSVPVLRNDSDPDGDSLSIQNVTQPRYGSVTILADGTLRYAPGRRAKNFDSFSYTATDGRANATATVVVTIAASAGGKPAKGR